MVLEAVHVPGRHKELVSRRKQVALGRLRLEDDLLVLWHRDGNLEGTRLAFGNEEHLGQARSGSDQRVAAVGREGGSVREGGWWVVVATCEQYPTPSASLIARGGSVT